MTHCLGTDDLPLSIDVRGRIGARIWYSVLARFVVDAWLTRPRAWPGTRILARIYRAQATQASLAKIQRYFLQKFRLS